VIFLNPGERIPLEQVYCSLAHDKGIPPNINLEKIAEECKGVKYATKFINEKPKVVLNLSNGFGGHLAAILTRTYEG
jgi:3-oxoacyl-(acyl-carrier-protein) synthase